MSVGHISRALEEAGIPTVAIVIKAYEQRARLMKVPRAVVTRHPMGRTMGAANDTERQSAVLEDAFALLESATAGGSIIIREDKFRPGSIA